MMFRNGLLSKFFVVILLTVFTASFPYAGEGEGNDKEPNSSLNADKDGEVEGNNQDSNSSLDANQEGNNKSVVTSLPEKNPETSLLTYILIVITFLLIVLHIVFKIERTPRFTIRRRSLMKTKVSTPLSEGSNQSDLSALMKNINDMSQTFMTLKTNLDQKDEEIARYKDGYDATIFKNFLLRFTRVDKVIKEYIADNKIDINGLKDIQIQMDDALAECDVEIFSPEIGADFKSTIGVADNPEIRDTSDKSKDSTIAEILIPGYRRKLPNNENDDYQIIIEAKVVIYVYKES